MRLLIMAGLGAGRAVAVQQPVEPVADAGHIGPGLNADQQLVEGAVHAEGLGQGAFVQPQRGVAQVVGQQIGRCCLVDHFRAARDAADLQARVAPIDDRDDRIVRLQAVSAGKSVAYHRLVGTPGFRQAAGQQVQPVEQRLTPIRDRQGQAAYRLVEAGHVQAQRCTHTGQHAADSSRVASSSTSRSGARFTSTNRSA